LDLDIEAAAALRSPFLPPDAALAWPAAASPPCYFARMAFIFSAGVWVLSVMGGL
jgi:hypothetical protein